MEREETAARLDGLAGLFQHWLDWNQKERDAEKLSTDDGTHVISVPPHWPSRGSLKHWIDTIRSAQLLSAKQKPHPPSREQKLEAALRGMLHAFSMSGAYDVNGMKLRADAKRHAREALDS